MHLVNSIRHNDNKNKKELFWVYVIYIVCWIEMLLIE